MPRITSKELQGRRRDFLEEAGRAFDQMMGSDGHNGLDTFAQREDRACDLGDALTRRHLEEHLGADELADPEGQIDCPICGRPVSDPSPQEPKLQPRRVRTRRGPIDYERAARHCKHCRRVFFPRG